MNLCDAAVELAALGYHVFPLRPRTKEPATGKGGFHHATRDERTILHWWDTTPDANIGIACGKSGVAVWDIDAKAGADPEDALAELDLEGAPVILTGEAPEPDDRHPASLAGVRGAQVFFRGNLSGTSKLSVAGTEIRGRQHYICAPPSVHPCGIAYEGTLPPVNELPETPDWLLALVQTNQTGNGNAAAVPATIVEGDGRNRELASFAGSMRRRGAENGEMLAALKAMNENRCRPPLDAEEVGRIAASIARYDPASIGRYEPGTPPKTYEFATLDEFSKHAFPDAEPLLGEHGSILLAVGSLFLVYGSDGAGKSTFTIDAAAHLAAGKDWLGQPVPRPARCLLIENEGPAGLFQGKLAAKLESWAGPSFAENIHVYSSPWGELTFADEHARTALRSYCDEHQIDVVMANPTLGLGVGPSGRPDETQQFVDWLKDCGLGSSRAFWIIHHENKAGQISGDWGRHPDTKVQLTADGTAQRTKLLWEKVRWATLAPEDRAVMLEWELGTQGYTVTPLDTVGASDDLLVQRLVDYLDSHPASATKHVCENIAGTDSRLVKLLKERPEFDCADGPHNAKLWMNTNRSAA